MLLKFNVKHASRPSKVHEISTRQSDASKAQY